MRHVVTVVLSLWLATPLLINAATAEPAAQKAVLVTGASTGIGRKVTERLAADGYFVYAGARKESDLKELAAIKNVQPVRLDVTARATLQRPSTRSRRAVAASTRSSTTPASALRGRWRP